MAIADDFDDIIGTAKASSEDVAGWLNLGFKPLNKILSGMYGGGLGYGRLYEIYGENASGKTILATNAMIEAQKAGGIAILVDFEQAFMVNLAVDMGLDITRLYHMQPETWEEGISKGMRIASAIRTGKKVKIDKDAPIVMVVDSIASAIPQSVAVKELTEMTMNDTTALSRATGNLKIVAWHCKKKNVVGLFLNQLRLKPGVMFGDPRTTPGGKAMGYYASGRLSISKKSIVKQVKGDKVIVGFHITIKCVKSKHTKFGNSVSIDFMYREDGSAYFDIIGSTIDYLAEKDFIKKTGEKKSVKFVWTDGKEYTKAALVKKIEVEGDAEIDRLLADD